MASLGHVDGAGPPAPAPAPVPAPIPPIPLNPVRALLSAGTWLAVTHLLVDLWYGVIAFASVFALLSAAVSTLPALLLGVPIFVGTVYWARALAVVERGRHRLLLGVVIDAPPRADPSLPPLRRVWRTVIAPATWRQVGYHLLMLPLGGVTTSITITMLTVPAVLLPLPAYYHRLPGGFADFGVFHVGTAATAWALAAAGALVLLLAPLVVRGLVAVDGAVARALLGRYGRRELAVRVDELEQTRRRSVEAAEAERRRIERDLHDGAQQRLVALAMTLGRARSRYRREPEAIGELLDEAHTEAKQAVAELRDLTRGIHPPVLTDRGLDAALSALAARSPVTVSVTVDVARRPSQTVEAIAYFVVAEALTNIAKHSGARRASVVVRRDGATLRVMVVDDGHGGADPAGSGLRGLADRVAGIDGRLNVDSPPGGPTTLTVELPCA